MADDSNGADTPTDAPRRNPNLCAPWKPGQSGNPAGRPKGARAKLSEDFCAALLEDFAKHGIAAIETMRAERPNEYAKMIAGMLPKEVTGENGDPLSVAAVAWVVRDSDDT